MNKRIKELAEQAGFTVMRGYGLKETVPEDVFIANACVSNETKKFAELIVRECVKVMYDDAIERKVPPDINQTPTHYVVAVLKHFGVKE